MLNIEQKRELLDTLYHSGRMTPAEADLYHEAYLRITIEELGDMASVPDNPSHRRRFSEPSQGSILLGATVGPDGKLVPGSVRVRLGTWTGYSQHRPGKGERPRVSRPKTYKDAYTPSGRKRSTPRPLVLGELRLAEMIQRRKASWEAVHREPEPKGCEPCPEYRPIRLERLDQPSRYVQHLAWTTPDGVKVPAFMAERATGEVVVLEKTTRQVGGDFRDPSSGDHIRSSYYVGTGLYV